MAKFIQKLGKVERELRAKPEARRVDAKLHESIMQEVRAAAAETSARAHRDEDEAVGRGIWLTWLMPSMAALALVFLGIWWLAHPVMAVKTTAGQTDMAAAPGAALELGARMPGMFMAPLSNELARVDHDIHQTTQVLLASFP